MPDTETSLRGKRIFVPSWKAPVPIVERIDKEMGEALAAYFQRSGYPPDRAVNRAMATVQWTLESAYKRAIGASIRRYAVVYARLYPHLWREDGTLAGFDPAEMVWASMPHEKSPGRLGKKLARQTMRTFAEKEAHAASN